MPPSRWLPMILCWLLVSPSLAGAQATRETASYQRIKAALDAVPAIDTHDHLWPFDKLPGYVETEHGKGMNLAGLWHNSYYRWTHSLTPWKPGMKFDDWWAQARNDFANARATSFYRYQLPAFQDLYGIDFDRITDEQARKLNDRIYRNYLDQRWLYEVITEKANIELLLNDPYWARYEFKQDYPFAVLVLNVTPLVRGFHPSEFPKTADDPYHFAKQQGLKVASLDDYLTVLDRLFREAKAKGAVCLKSTLAYRRTLHFENVPKERAARHFGKPKGELTAEQVKEFEDFLMWRLVELSARHSLPFQIHTGQARIQGSNPMLLVDLIEANPKTKFILFHGGYPWVGESAVIAQRHKNVWLDSCWLPTLSYSTAKRAYHEWLDAIPSNKILWGADCNHAEGIYGATEFTRRCLAEVLAEKVDRGDLIEEHALKIGRQVLRENALELFPPLKERLWKGKSKLTPPASGKGVSSNAKIYPPYMRPTLIAHRGASADAPEHTLAAYELALKHGADFVEPDLQMTRDGVLVCLHDTSLERTTNVARIFPDRAKEVKGKKTWPVAEFTLAEIQKLDAGSWKAPRFAGARVPTFQQMIDTVKGKAGIIPETKAPEVYGKRGLNMEKALMEVLKANNLATRGADPKTPVIIQSFSADSLKALRKEQGCQLPLVYLMDKGDVSPERLKQIKAFAEGISPSKALVLAQPEMVKDAHALGLSVTVWTFRAEKNGKFKDVREEMAYFLRDLGVDAVFTDNPERFPRE